jgi:hypothetical protein
MHWNDQFDKTGSGQTWEKLRKRGFYRRLSSPDRKKKKGAKGGKGKGKAKGNDNAKGGKGKGKAPAGKKGDAKKAAAAARRAEVGAQIEAHRESKRHLQVTKRSFFSHLYIKMMILPRQARDKHRENSKKVPFSRRRSGAARTAALPPSAGAAASFLRAFLHWKPRLYQAKLGTTFELSKKAYKSAFLQAKSLYDWDRGGPVDRTFCAASGSDHAAAAADCKEGRWAGGPAGGTDRRNGWDAKNTKKHEKNRLLSVCRVRTMVFW